MAPQHLAGLPIEEILLAGALTVAPMIAYLGWEISSRLKRLRTGVLDRIRRRP
ncbi:hypothetical protein [Kribbella deserti]|uniref:YvrJ family protein n=1 Tax=Kribbella deserti TaxID=1926257 RepID=A0ABV6QM25_9ACTN